MAKAKYKEKEKEKEDPKRPQPVSRGAYVMMLFITLVAVIAGCVMMYLDNEEYSGKSPPKEAAPAIQKLGDPYKDKDTGAPGAPPAPGVPGPGPMGTMP